MIYVAHGIIQLLRPPPPSPRHRPIATLSRSLPAASPTKVHKRNYCSANYEVFQFVFEREASVAQLCVSAACSWARRP